MGDVTSIEIAIRMIIALYKEGLINKATYEKIISKYKTESVAKA